MSVSPTELRLYFLLVTFGMGLLTFSAGIFVLVVRALGSDVRKMAVTTARLAQKGILEDAAGMVGNATALMRALNEMVRTAAGTGIFLIVLGLTLMYFSYLQLLHLTA